jgi:hypothetical protein
MRWKELGIGDDHERHGQSRAREVANPRVSAAVAERHNVDWEREHDHEDLEASER